MTATVETLLQEAIRIPSVHPALGGPGEAALAEWVVEKLRAAGAEVQRQTVQPGRANIIAAVRAGEGPAILLEAHLDTVAVGEGWSVDPYGGERREDRIYGRGACDTKASLATFLGLFCHYVRQPARLARPLVFAAVVDEEVEQRGAFALMEAGLDLALAVTGEPTDCQIVHAHKGFVRGALRTTGVAAHSSSPERGVNAILRMGRVLERMERYAEQLTARAPHPLLGHGSVNVGQIAGGLGVNVVPASCEIRLDRRTLPGETAATVRAEIDTLLKDLGGVGFAEVVERSPLHTPADHPLLQTLHAAVRRAGGPADLGAKPYLTNAVAYAAAGVPAIAFGPGSVEQAHRPDEFVTIAQLHRAQAILQDWLEQPPSAERGASPAA